MSLCKDLIFLILQFCDEENLKRTAHMLEQETGYFFDLKYFEELLLNGNWEEAEKYLSNFTVVEDNKYSTKIYFEIRKQKFLEALDKHEHAVALHILLKDLKVFAQSNKELYKEMTQLLVLDDFREHSLLTFYGDTLSARKRMIQELRTVIEANPLLQGRTRFPQINKSRLRRLINQSLNWQHIHCAHPHPQPHIDTLFTDHKCPGPDNMQDQLNKESSLIDAHVGSVNDLAFSKPHEKLVLISCGDDKLIQVWDAVTGAKQYTFEGHGAPVYSVCPHVKENVHIRRLVYTHAGNGILALAENGTHLLWRWVKSDANLSGEATTRCAPQLWQPKSGLLMINDVPENSLDVVTPCFSLSRNDSYVISASGRMVSLYNMLIFKKLRNVMRPPPAATCIVFYPPDNNIIAIGMDDSTILIYNIRVDEVISKLQGHSKRISGLAFSTTLNVLVSCGVDTEIVVWDCGTWEKKKSTILQISVGWLASELSETNIELDKDQKHFLAVHETQLAIYETTTLRRVKQWTIANFCTRISHATYSCDSQWVYGAMRDGILLILDASDLAPRFEIDPSAYLPPRLSCYVDPVVVAAHPHKPYQFALGLSNGGVVVIEPLESEGGWSAIPIPAPAPAPPLEENSGN
ncbi:UNVERIFIED_CONTAM: Topless-related protein 1 [Sesamum latifolium]|uniref:Topless-related protein 1 n=1 Tax=Sesamum latifolium TaxID=2727402 RepID=A0AAW2SP13_9LAMI